MRRPLGSVAVLLGVLASLAFASGASAAFPGTNGRIVFVSDRDGNKEIYSAKADGTDPKRLTANLVADADPAYSPDGTRIAFTRGGDIWVMNADGTGAGAITGLEGAGDSEPAWSPDGTQIVYVSNQSVMGGGTTGPELFVTDVVGSGPKRQVTDTPVGASRAPAWSPDGATIAYSSNSDGSFEVFTIPASTTAGTGTRRSANDVGQNYQNPSWAPGGGRIAYERGTGTATSDTTKEIWTMDADGANPVQLTSNGVYDAQPAFSPDGTKLAFESAADGNLEIHTMDATPLAPGTNITNTSSGVTDQQPDWGDFVAPPPPPPPDDPGGGPGNGGGDPGGGSPGGGDKGPAPACQEKQAVGVVEAVGCLELTDDGWRSTRTIWVNGLALVPVGGAELLFNRRAKRLRSAKGEVQIWAGKSLLREGALDWDLSPIGGVVRALFTATRGANFGKLPARGDIAVRFVQGFRALVGGVASMPFMENLQRICGSSCPSVTADVTVVTNNKGGLEEHGFKIAARNVPLGALSVKTLDATWDPVTDRFEGAALMTFYIPSAFDVRVNLITQAGRLVSATASERNLRIPLLNITFPRLDLAINGSPFEVTGQLEAGAGPQFAGRQVIGADGSFFMRPGAMGALGRVGTGRLHVDGRTRVFSLESSGYFDAWGSGAVNFGARVDLGLPFAAKDPRTAPVYIGASLDGWLARSIVGAEGAAELRVFGALAARAEMVLSNVGWAACGQLGWLRGGAARRWSGSPTIMGGSCDVGPYRAGKSVRAAQGAPRTVTLRDSERGAVLRVRGSGGAPKVILDGPGGQHVEASSDGSPVVNQGFVVLQDAEGSATHVAIRRPKGTWRVSLAEGSPPIAGIDSADVLDQASVTARVGGKGSKRTLTWKLRRLPGQKVTFAELGTDAVHVIKKTSAARGSVRFTPAGAYGRARTIVALVEQGGVPRDTLKVARYKAPAWAKPAKPRKLRARRKGSKLAVSWAKAAGAARYMVFVTASDGERQVFVVPARKRRVSVAGVEPGDRALVTVAGMRSDGALGRAAKQRLKPVRKRR